MSSATAGRKEHYWSASRRRRPYRRRVLLMAVVVALAAAALGAWSAREAARQRYVARLAAAVEECQRAGRVSAGQWWRLPPAERRLVALALLADPQVAWDASLEERWLVDLLAGILLGGRGPDDRLAAARALGEMATRTPLEAGDVPQGLDPAANALLSAAERDPDRRVRCAAAAGALRLRPVARAFGLGGS